MAYSAENVAADYNALFNSEQAPKLVYNKAEKRQWFRIIHLS